MKKATTTLASLGLGLAAMMTSGCDAVETGIHIEGILENAGDFDPVTGEITCDFSPGTPSPAFVVFELAYSKTFRLPFGWSNGLAVDPIPFGDTPRGVDLRVPNEVRPLRFEIRWECDSQGFSSDLEALIVPAFHPTLPFCLDRRADVNQEFVGFDVVQAQGKAVEPTGEGVFTANVIPHQLGAALDDTLRIATLADRCCRVPGSRCDGQSADPACTELEAIFSAIAPGELRVASNQANEASQDLLRFRPFAIFDGNYIRGVDERYKTSLHGADYPLKLRGVMEGVTAAGDSVVSDEVVETISVCKNCGPDSNVNPGSGATRGRWVSDDNVCYHTLL